MPRAGLLALAGGRSAGAAGGVEARANVVRRHANPGVLDVGLMVIPRPFPVPVGARERYADEFDILGDRRSAPRVVKATIGLVAWQFDRQYRAGYVMRRGGEANWFIVRCGLPGIDRPSQQTDDFGPPGKKVRRDAAGIAARSESARRWTAMRRAWKRCAWRDALRCAARARGDRLIHSSATSSRWWMEKGRGARGGGGRPNLGRKRLRLAKSSCRTPKHPDSAPSGLGVEDLRGR